MCCFILLALRYSVEIELDMMWAALGSIFDDIMSPALLLNYVDSIQRLSDCIRDQASVLAELCALVLKPRSGDP